MSIKVQESINNLEKRIISLKSAITKYHTKIGTDEEEDYLELIIKRFESADETAKKLMQVYLEYLGERAPIGAKNLFIKMHEFALIDSDSWFNMNTDRNNTAHEYDERFVKELADKVINIYLILIENFYISLIEDFGQ